MKKFLWSVFGVGALLVGAQAVYSAVDSQQFTVVVPKRVSIVAPVADQVKTLTIADLTAAELTGVDDVAFTAQQWAVKGNVRNGVSVNFVAAPFLNITHFPTTTINQNARLTVARIAATTTGPATWSLTSPSGTSSSNYAAVAPASPNALVAYSSNRVGQTDFAVTVEFLAADLNAVVEGDYVTTVVGTLTEN